MRKKWIVVLVALAVVWWSANAKGPTLPAYTITDLGILPGGNEAEAYAINNSGQIVGWSAVASNGHPHAFLWEDGVMEDLGALSADRTRAHDISESGVVVGSRQGPHGKYYPVAWKHGEIIELGGGEGYARGVNNRGQIVGHSDSTDNGACIWEDGEITGLAGGWGAAGSINDAGRVVGIGGEGPQAFLWEKNSLTYIAVLPGYDHSDAGDINNSGQIAGHSFRWEEEDPWDPGSRREYFSRAFLWEDGVFTELGTLGGENSFVGGMNNRGQVVGLADNADGDPRMFIWDKHNGMLDLNDLLEDGSDWVLLGAIDINDSGQIVGTGYLDGQKRGFLMTRATNGGR